MNNIFSIWISWPDLGFDLNNIVSINTTISYNQTNSIIIDNYIYSIHKLISKSFSLIIRLSFLSLMYVCMSISPLHNIFIIALYILAILLRTFQKWCMFTKVGSLISLHTGNRKLDLASELWCAALLVSRLFVWLRSYSLCCCRCLLALCVLVNIWVLVLGALCVNTTVVVFSLWIIIVPRRRCSRCAFVLLASHPALGHGFVVLRHSATHTVVSHSSFRRVFV